VGADVARDVRGTAAAALVGVVLASAALVGCTGHPAGSRPPNPPGWERITLPGIYDGYSLHTFCDHGNRIYITFAGGNYAHSMAAVPDPTCGR
jgi:hypothetical protein